MITQYVKTCEKNTYKRYSGQEPWKWAPLLIGLLCCRARTPVARWPCKKWWPVWAVSMRRWWGASGPTSAWSCCTWPTTMRSDTASRLTLPSSGTWPCRPQTLPSAIPSSHLSPYLSRHCNHNKLDRQFCQHSPGVSSSRLSLYLYQHQNRLGWQFCQRSPGIPSSRLSPCLSQHCNHGKLGWQYCQRSPGIMSSHLSPYLSQHCNHNKLGRQFCQRSPGVPSSRLSLYLYRHCNHDKLGWQFCQRSPGIMSSHLSLYLYRHCNHEKLGWQFCQRSLGVPSSHLSPYLSQHCNHDKLGWQFCQHSPGIVSDSSGFHLTKMSLVVQEGHHSHLLKFYDVCQTFLRWHNSNVNWHLDLWQLVECSDVTEWVSFFSKSDCALGYED